MEKLNYVDYPKKTYIEIEGIDYAYDFFKMIGMGLMLNEPFIIVERKNKTVTVEKYKSTEEEIVPIPDKPNPGMIDYQDRAEKGDK